MKYQEDFAFHIERRGLEPVPDEGRYVRPGKLFYIWFASDISPFSILYGAILFAAGLSLWQSGIVAAAAVVGSFALVAVLSLASRASGSPMLATSRAAFGPRGNLGPVLISWLNLVGWEIFSVVFATYTLLGVLHAFGLPSTGFWPTVTCLVLSLLPVTFIATLGYATLVWIQRAATFVFGGASLVVGALLLAHTNWAAVLSIPPGPWATTGLALFSIMFAANGATWLNVGGDYTRYLPQRSTARTIIFWTVAGAGVPILLLMFLGFVLSSAVPNLAGAYNPVAVIDRVLPPLVAAPYLLTVYGSLLASELTSSYSAGQTLLSGLTVFGLHLERTRTIWIDVAVILIGAAYILFYSQSFLDKFESFLLLITAGLITWAAVFLVDMLQRRGRYDAAGLSDVSPRSSYFYWRGVNLGAVGAWLVGLIVALLFTASPPLFRGPLAVGMFARSNWGYFIGGGVSALLYALALSLQGVVSRKQVASKEREPAQPQLEASEE